MKLGMYAAASAAALAVASPAMAATVSISGSYTFGDTYNTSNGGPGITNNLTFPVTATVNAALPGTTPTNFATFAPAPTCTGGGCVGGTSGTETDPVWVTFGTFNFNFGNGVTATALGFTEYGTFEAKYSGSEIACAVGDGMSPSSGQTDCLLWSGTTQHGQSSVFSELMSNGDTLTVTFADATDWNITPKISFDVVDAPAVPESSTWAMMMLGFAGLGFAAYRGRGRSAISIV